MPLETITKILFWALMTMTAFQIVSVGVYFNGLRPYWRSDSQRATPRLNLKTAVLLCLRGADPFLPDCLRALLQQDYANYEVHIVVDSLEDPAWEIVQQTLRELNSPVATKVTALQQPRSSCSLKCSSLLQAVNDLPADVEVVAFIDADTIAHPLWLQELVNPFADPQMGLTTGSRWYIPVGDRLGTIVRYLWNAFAIISTYFGEMPWGGTLAVRAKHLKEPRLQQRWANSLCEDVPLHVTILSEDKLKFKFVPSLLIVNREECELSSFVRWSTRQLTFARLYHPKWNSMAAISFISSLIPILTWVQLGYAIATQQWQPTLLLSSGLAAFYTIGTILPLVLLDYGVRRVVEVWSQSIPALSFSKILSVLVAINVSFFTSLIALIASLNKRQVEWRGIQYTIESSQKVHLVEYFPFRSRDSVNTSKISI
jgi:cellulose synthase/poly-beta-1,6-N-acetylglucosamine synthase-like glycosyltransferase